MSKLVIEIDMDGAAFEDYPEQEVRRILLDWWHKWDISEPPAILRDNNGNRCGTARVEE